MFKYRNSILISKLELSNGNDLFESIKYCSFYISKCKSIPHIAHGNYIIFGWLWSSVTGQLFSPSEYQCLTKENYLDCMEEYSGRYLVLTSDGYIFTDATSSFPVYFNAKYISTNLSRLCEVGGIKQCSGKGVYSSSLVLPPRTHVDGVSRLMPGGYLNLDDMQADLFTDFLKPKNDSNATKDNVIKCLKHNAYGIEKLVRQDYRLMLTGGKDSRLSLLCLKAISNSKLKTFTHKKHLLYNDLNDITIFRKLSKVLKLDHMFTAPAKQSMPDSYHQHCAKLTQEQ